MAKQKTGKRPKSAPSDKARRLRGLTKGGSRKTERSHHFKTEGSMAFCLRALAGIIVPIDKPIQRTKLLVNDDPTRPRYGVT